MGTAATDRLEQALDDALPQTQCTRCGYPDCRTYARAISMDEAEINQCPPGGEEGIARLAWLTGRPRLPLNPAHGAEARRQLAVIDEAWCIGCTLCLKACPVDAIVGGPKGMHTVIESACTGCELCLPPCPVDCIALVPVTGARTGWNAWSAPQAATARERFGWHRVRLERDALAQSQRLATGPRPATPGADDPSNKRAVVAAALARARASQSSG